MITNENARKIAKDENVPHSEFSILLQFASICSSTTEDELNVIEELKSVMDSLTKVKIIHLETRRNNKEATKSLENGFDCLLVLRCGTAVLDETKRTLEKLSNLQNLQVLLDSPRTYWVPRHVSELDKCLHLSLKFQPQLQTDHPGFHDMKYIQRREEISKLAFTYRYGDHLPVVEYTKEELSTWKAVYNKLRTSHAENLCAEYLEGLKLLEDECGFSPNCIPQLETISRFLERTSGFRLRPVAGLVSSRDFLAHFAYRIFPCTQYVRHQSRPMHTPEPDCIHEFLGHVPVLTNRPFADFAQMLGIASLGASDEVIKKISTLFWFTVEFGLCMESGQLKVIGAGIVSSFGELENVFSDASVKRDFNPAEAALQAYDDVSFQPVYFVCQAIEAMKKKMGEYLLKIPRSQKFVYDPVTQSIEIRSPELHKKILVKELQQKIEELDDLNSQSFNSSIYIHASP